MKIVSPSRGGQCCTTAVMRPLFFLSQRNSSTDAPRSNAACGGCILLYGDTYHAYVTTQTRFRHTHVLRRRGEDLVVRQEAVKESPVFYFFPSSRLGVGSQHNWQVQIQKQKVCTQHRLLSENRSPCLGQTFCVALDKLEAGVRGSIAPHLTYV